MRRRQIIAQGKIDSAGRMKVYMDEIKAFCAQWQNANITLRIDVAEQGASESLKGYYYHYIVPTFRQALWDNGERMIEDDVERFLRSISPVAVQCIANIEKAQYTRELKKITDMSNAELIEHIEFLKQLGAEEYSIYVEDPRIL